MGGLSARRLRTALAAALLVTLLPLATVGCFGSFQLTRKIYSFNRGISSDKWIRWITFLVLTVVPAYPIGLAIDAVFANSIEFWSGSNPFAVAPGTTRTAFGPRGEVVTVLWAGDGSLRLEIVPVAGPRQTLWLLQEEGTVAVYDASGQRLARLVDLSTSPKVLWH